MKTTISARPEDMEEQRVWYIMDAADKPLGRLAVDAAKILRGKHKTIFTPHVDTGDHVIIINAEKVVMTGATKGGEPIYHHTGWPGALKSVKRQQEMDRRPEEAIRRVVRGMIPHNKLGDAIIKKLKVYRGPVHPHAAQQPIPFTGGVQKRGEE
jgi:large subunit ribosomal protein L13